MCIFCIDSETIQLAGLFGSECGILLSRDSNLRGILSQSRERKVCENVFNKEKHFAYFYFARAKVTKI